VSGEVGAQARTIINGLAAGRLAELAAELGVKLARGSREEQIKSLSHALRDIEPLAFFGRLRREELRSACKLRGLPWRARSRAELTTTLIGRHVDVEAIDRAFQPWQPPVTPDVALPTAGQIVRVRQRQYLVEEVLPGAGQQGTGQQSLVRLVGLDDDDAGRRLEVLWELELDRQIIEPEAQKLPDVRGLDGPRRFAAYYYALLWNCTTATDARLFQAHLRAGIRVSPHQLVPLRKALELPRVNLFIADDVGVGKTIEAGLIMQELILRGQIDRVLVVCPAAVTVQWRDELQRRFGLRFEIYGRTFVARRREERGFGVNPWATYPRFVVSYQTLRRREHWEPLLQNLGEQARRSLLILDEAHTAAPASKSARYATDSDVTRAVRKLAPMFEHRLFLSATPHNGHSNSFSSLLNLLDPQRFTRGVPVTPDRLAPVMVRRLKSDLLRLGVEGYPERKLHQIDLTWRDGRWSEELHENGKPLSRRDLGEAGRIELDLSELLAKYRDLTGVSSKRGRLVLANLQKRLLSSVEAFARTLNRHAETVSNDATSETSDDFSATEATEEALTDEGEEIDDETVAEQDDRRVQSASRTFPPLTRDAREVLDDMVLKARQGRAAPGAKVLSLIAWIRANQCEAVALGGAERGKSRSWSPRRLIVFTEYVDTKRYLAHLLRAAFQGTERGDERLTEFHGGLSEDQREQISQAFNGDPAEYPVRILLATDAAREGLNLHYRCADLLHFDIPWNPARLEQRNGRIDRALQPEPVVRCGYFVYPERAEDKVLETLVTKTDRIRRELGSLGAVLMERIEETFAGGIGPETADRLATADSTAARQVVEAELEAAARDRAEDETIREIINRSDEFMPLKPALLQRVVDAGLELAQRGRLEPAPEGARRANVEEAFAVPATDPNGSWSATLDTLRPARGRDEAIWQWRQGPLKPVVFRAPHTMTDEVVQLHLAHPLAQRLLARFRSQGWAAHDLSRVTVLRNDGDALTRVIAVGRLTLFGPGAIRLHEELVLVAARWRQGKDPGRLKPFAEKADGKAIERLRDLLSAAPAEVAIPKAVQQTLCEGAKGDFAALWPHVQAEAESRQHDAATKLRSRGRTEAEALRQILAAQRQDIERKLADRQVPLAFSVDERSQLEADRTEMVARLEAIPREMVEDPARIERRYQIALKRVEAVGLVYLYPEVG
jgi:hypothetical protein